MYCNKIFIFLMAFSAINVFAENHSFPVVGVLSLEDEAKLTPTVATPINDGWQTVVSGEKEIDKNELLKDLISDESPIKNPYVINLAQESKNKGHLEIKKGSTDVFDAIATRRAVLCRFGITNGLSAIVFDKEQPELTICEKIQYQILQLSKNEETDALLSEKGKSFSGSIVGAAGLVGTGFGAAAYHVIKSFNK